MKGVSFSNKRYRKGVPFLKKMVYKRVKGLDLGGGASPYKTFLSTPPPPGGGNKNLSTHLYPQVTRPNELRSHSLVRASCQNWKVTLN